LILLPERKRLKAQDHRSLKERVNFRPLASRLFHLGASIPLLPSTGGGMISSWQNQRRPICSRLYRIENHVLDLLCQPRRRLQRQQKIMNRDSFYRRICLAQSGDSRTRSSTDWLWWHWLSKSDVAEVPTPATCRSCHCSIDSWEVERGPRSLQSWRHTIANRKAVRDLPF
jgi:hypothetical protein